MNAKQSALNLRKSNFTFGYDQPTLESKYQSTFSEAPNIEQHKEDMKSITKKGNQKINIKIDNDQGQKDHYLSTTKQCYVSNPYQNVKLTDDQRKEISGSHTVFGTDDKQYYLSEQKDHFKELKIDDNVYKDKKEHANSLRKHAYSFGGIKKYYDTSYQSNMCKIKDEDCVQNIRSMNNQISNQKKDLKQPHVIMGFQNNLLQNRSYHDNVQQLPQQINNQCNIVYGNDKIDYITTKQKNVCGKPNKTIKVTGDMIKDLRSSHFPMGYDEVKYQTESAQNFEEKKYEFQPPMNNGRETHLKFEQDRKYTTMNDIFFKPKGNAKEEMIINPSNNVCLGFDQDQWISEQKHQYEQKQMEKQSQKNPLNQLKKIDLAQCQLKDDWGSVMKQQYQNYDQYLPNVLSDALKKEIRVQHFQYGSQKDDNICKIGAQQRKNNDEQVALFNKIKTSTRKANVLMGRDKLDYQSYYAKQFSQRN